ncbi:MAG TPA: hypothetical protein PLY25_10165 [Bacteroidia bacterium]|nr:hypothetical protein [Bacteroidia bacterium]
MSAILVLTVLTHSFAHSQESKSYLIDSVQLSRANQNYVYARSCKEIKDTLFIALDTALSIINSQKLQIAAQDSAKAKCDARYQLLQEDEAALKKQVKKERNRKTANAILLYVSVGVNFALAAIILFR